MPISKQIKIITYQKLSTDKATPTDCSKSVSNRCVIEIFLWRFVLSCCFSDFSVGLRAFVIRLNQISSVFSYNGTDCYDDILELE